jgi:hypothetical protein
MKTKTASINPQSNELQSPLVHMNGTGKDRMIDSLCEASNALNEAFIALKAIAPNGRDYYPLGSQAMERAVLEHESRTRMLDEIKAEIDAIVFAVSEQ